MELSNQEDEIPIPINSTYVGGHIIHHHHDNHHIPQIPTSNNNINNNGHGHVLDHHQDDLPLSFPLNNKIKQGGVKYKECQKNHAASIGGSATDGCGEFMPSGEEGTIEALTCSACNCHRNFHRKEIDGFTTFYPPLPPISTRKLMLTHHHNKNPTRPHQMMMMSSYNSNNNNMGGSNLVMNSESDEQEEGDGGGGVLGVQPHHHHLHHHNHHQQMVMRKRFRTKFTQEQKEKMLNFAERVGWKIQKQEDSVVQQFCQEIGVKRRVLKVWMHNNKLNLAKKNLSTTTANTTTTSPTTTTAPI